MTPFLRSLAIGASALWMAAANAFAASGDVDPTFIQATGGITSSIAVQADGRIVLGQPNGDGSAQIRRIDLNGYADDRFDAVTVNGNIRCLVTQPDGKILLGGDFTTVAGVERKRIARLNSDGSLDTTFNPAPDGVRVAAIAAMPDGSVVFGGWFSQVAGQPRNGLAKISPAGELEAFGATFYGQCCAIHLQADGNLLLGGLFSHAVNGEFVNNVARISPEGVFDAAFMSFTDFPVTWLSEQPGGKVLMIHSLSPGTSEFARFKRVDAVTGAEDTTFVSPLTLGATIHAASMQTNGSLMIAGKFQHSGTSYNLARLGANGAFDPSFAVHGTQPIRAIAPLAGGKLLVGGDFTQIRTSSIGGLARLLADPVSTPVVAADSSTVEWQRSVTSPLLSRVTFESRTGNGAWTYLGDGQKINGGWQLTGTTLPADGAVRARGYVSATPHGSIHTDYLFRGNAQPQLTIEHAGTVIPAGGTLEVGDLLVDFRWTRDVKLTNTGDRTLEQLSISAFTGMNHMPLLPASLQPEESVMIRLSAVPATAQPLNASITIASNAANAATYPITLSGNNTKVFSPVFNSPTDIPISSSGSLFKGQTFGTLTLGFAPQPGTVLTAISGLTESNAFSNLPDGSIITADYQGVTYRFVAGYISSQFAPLDFTLTLLGGDGTYEMEYVNGSSSLEAEDDGAIHNAYYRHDPAGVRDPVFGNTISLGSSPTTVHLVNGDRYRATSASSPPPTLVKIRNDGRQDLTFNATINGPVLAMAAQRDDRLLIGGSFTDVSGQPRTSLARLHPDGSADTTFASPINLTGNSVKAIAVQADGKILIGTTNAMTLPGGSSKVARLHPDGTVDTSFSLATDYVDRLLVQPDGKIVKLGFAGGTPEYLSRYLPDGSVDGGFSVPVDNKVTEVALLADGKLLISGPFSRIGTRSFSGLARLHPDGTPDLTFLGKTLFGPSDILVSGKNELFIGGNFGSVNGVRSGQAKLSNPTAITSTAQVNANTIRWTRQGAAAELDWVKAEFIPQAGGIPVSLGFAQRVSTGWEITSPNPLSNGTVRLYGPATHSSGMIVMAKELVQVGITAPQLELTWDEQPLANGTPKDFGTMTMGQPVMAFFRMKNVGAGTANAPVATIEGPHAEDYTLTQVSPTPLGTGEQRTFLLRIYPRDGGARSAQLVIRTPERSQPLQVIPLGFQTTNNVINPVFNSASDIPMTTSGFDAAIMRLGTFTLNFAPTPTTVLTLVSNTGSSPTTGTLRDLPRPGLISAEYNGVTYHFGPNYTGGSGNDLTLKLLGNGDILPGFQAGADAQANGIAIQPDGKVIVTGFFDIIGDTPRDGIVRLHADGRVDNSFNASQAGQVENITILDDDRILLMGTGTVNGVPQTEFACLNPDGSLSEDFRVAFGYTETIPAQVVRLLKLRNGKIMVGGRFTTVNGELRTNLARLNADGTLDSTFTTVVAGQAPNAGYVYSITEQADGKLLIGGSFGSVNGTTRYCFARLYADGSLDQDFNPLFAPNTSTTLNDPFGTRVSTVMELADGKILLGGKFSNISGTPRTNFACLNADGTVDPTFNLVANDVVTCLNLQADGKLLIGGLFTTLGGQPRSRIARINPNGTLDPDYAPKASGTVTGMTLDREGDLWVTGAFTNMNGVTVTGLAKLRNDSGNTALTINSSTSVSWEVTGTAPALSEVKFELSTDGGAVWTPLGNGTKVTGGWTISGLTLPPHGYLRAKGKAIGGNRGFSAIEDVILFGRQPTKIEEWRMQQFGSFTNQRTGADLADADKDGVANLMEYAFGLDPQDTTSAEVPAWFNDGSQFELSFLPPPGIEGVTYGAEWSSTMNPSDWHNVPNQGTGSDQRYVVPKDATPFKFMRLKVTNMSSVPPP